MHKCETEAEVSVKGGCLEPLDLRDAVHIWCKEAIIKIPTGAKEYLDYSWEYQLQNGVQRIKSTS